MGHPSSFRQEGRIAPYSVHFYPASPPEVPDLRRLLTIVETAEVLAVGRTTVYELIAHGELEVVHIGRCARVPVASIDDLVAQLRIEATSA